MSELKVEDFIEIEGSINFRDLGGYQTEDGRQVVQGKIFRSGDLSKVTNKGIQQMQDLGITTICDFRGSEEVKNFPDPVIPNTRYFHMPVLPEDEQLLDPRKHKENVFAQMKNSQPGSLMIDLNKKMAEQTTIWQNFLHLLLEESNESLVYHCTAGKDRTGAGSAIVLRTLGVPEDVVLEDYEKTNQVVGQLQGLALNNVSEQDQAAYQAMMQPMLEARKDYLVAFLGEINKQYGSFTTYLEKGIGISEKNQAFLREKYLV